MRVRHSAAHCAPVCYVEAAANQHDIENKVRKTFTYVREQEGSYTLRHNIEDLSASLSELVLKIGRHAEILRNVPPKRKVWTDFKDLLYSLKAISFDIEEQLNRMSKERDVEGLAEAGRAHGIFFKDGRWLRDAKTGELDHESYWKNFYEILADCCCLTRGTEEFNKHMKNVWGGPEFEDRNLVEVVRDAEGNWVELPKK